MDIKELEREIELLKEKVKLLKEIEEIEARRTVWYIPYYPRPYVPDNPYPYWIYQPPTTTTGSVKL